MKRNPCLFALLFLGLLVQSLFAGFETGQSYSGFLLKEKRFVKEVNSECLYFIHKKSGARLFKIETNDANKTFSIAFKTVPESDCGTPHIMEHSVLNGSKRFPVKSPFDVLVKGSLNTYLNAMTGSDITVYPVASMNDADYFNLMHVYLDAVFNPLIYDDPRILMQEGWHHELTDEDGPVVYKGVVYNEMKGAYSSPTRELGYQIDKHLFPDNGYGNSSGGYPAAIPELTYENFLNFHRKYYHPDNSYILLYGNADLNRELAFIDAEYLSKYDRSDNLISIPLQKPFSSVKKVTSNYPLSEDAGTENQTYLALSFVCGMNTDRALVMALDVLTDVLVNQESAPIRVALQEAGVGREVSAFIDDTQQNVLQIRVQNANPEDTEKFHEIVFNTLKEVAKNGVDPKAVEGTLNRMEFRLREGDDAQKGLTYNFQMLNGWFFAEDPFLGLEFEKPLAKIKEGLNSGWLESLIEKYFINNSHALLLTLTPKPGLEKEINALLEAKLEVYKSSLSEKQKEHLISQTEDLIAYQKREDTPEALASIPLLDLKDIDPEAEWIDVVRKETGGIPILVYDTFTNGVVYTRLYFDLAGVPEELIPYVALLAEILGSLNTINYSYGELDQELNIHTGGFSTRVSSFLEDQDDDKLLPRFEVSSKSMSDKLPEKFVLIEEVLMRSSLDDAERLKAVLTRHQSRLDGNVKGNGYGYTRTRLRSYITKNGLFNEKTSGLDYYWFITDLTDNFEEKSGEIIDNLERCASLIFNRDLLVAAVSCDSGDMKAFSKNMKKLSKKLGKEKPEPAKWALAPSAQNEGLLAASKVQYVLKGYDFKELGYEWDGKMRVLNQILSSDWLYNQIRVVGGAYGGFSSFAPSGQVYFASYRDPNLKETLDNFDATPDYLETFEADESAMTRYIIGTIAGMDRPLTPSQKGNLATRRYFEKTTRNQVQQDRDAVLSTSAADIRNMKQLVSEILKKNVYCVYGNEEKIEENKILFRKVVPLSK